MVQSPGQPIQGPEDGSQVLKVMRMIWVFFLMSQFTYLFVLQRLTVDNSLPSSGRELEIPLSCVAIVMVFFSALLPRLFLKNQKHLNRSSCNRDILAAFFFPFLLRIVFLESCAVFGLLLGLIEKDQTKMYPFLAVSCDWDVFEFSES